LVLIVADIFTIILDIFLGNVSPDTLATELGALVVFSVLWYYGRRGHEWPAYVFLSFLAFVTPYAFRRELDSTLILGLALPVVVAPLVGRGWVSLPVAAIEVGLLYAFSYTLGYPTPSPVVVVIFGVLSLTSWLANFTLENAAREAQANAEALAGVNEELQEGRALLEARTRELSRYARQLETTTSIAQDAASMLDRRALVSRAVDMINEQFGYYHTAIYLLDPLGEHAVLEAASGAQGEQLLSRHYRVPVGGEGIIGCVTGLGETYVVRDSLNDSIFTPLEDLPETRSELALPLQARGDVIGVLDVHSARPNAFDEEAISVLEVLAAQVALALDNARLLNEAQQALYAMQRAYGEMSEEAWQHLVESRSQLGVLRSRRGNAPIGDLWRPEMVTAVETETTTSADAEDNRVATPIKARGRVIGVIDAQKPLDGGEWTPEQVTLLESLSEQVGEALESARLFRESQRLALRERTIRDITESMQGATSMEGLLRTATQALMRNLGGVRAGARLGLASIPAAPAGDGDEVGEEGGTR
jgi:GAF domain-containing protein